MEYVTLGRTGLRASVAGLGCGGFSRLGLGYAGSVHHKVGTSAANVKPHEAQVDYEIDYGLPGAADYRYTRPFDYFNFQGTASSANGIENPRLLAAGQRIEFGS